MPLRWQVLAWRDTWCDMAWPGRSHAAGDRAAGSWLVLARTCVRDGWVSARGQQRPAGGQLVLLGAGREVEGGVTAAAARRDGEGVQVCRCGDRVLRPGHAAVRPAPACTPAHPAAPRTPPPPSEGAATHCWFCALTCAPAPTSTLMASTLPQSAAMCSGCCPSCSGDGSGAGRGASGTGTASTRNDQSRSGSSRGWPR